MECQPSDLLSLGENECEKFLKAEKKDFTKLKELKDGSDWEFHKKTGLSVSTIKELDNITMPSICAAAVSLGCKISDIVDME